MIEKKLLWARSDFSIYNHCRFYSRYSCNVYYAWWKNANELIKYQMKLIKSFTVIYTGSN